MVLFLFQILSEYPRGGDYLPDARPRLVVFRRAFGCLSGDGGTPFEFQQLGARERAVLGGEPSGKPLYYLIVMGFALPVAGRGRAAVHPGKGEHTASGTARRIDWAVRI